MAEQVQIITIEVHLDKGVKKITINPKKIPLVLLEAFEEVEDGNFRHVRIGLKRLLGLTEEESYELDTENMQQMAEAIKLATTVPNE